MAFGVTLAGFVLTQTTLGLGHVLALPHRFRLIWGFSAACGTKRSRHRRTRQRTLHQQDIVLAGE